MFFYLFCSPPFGPVSHPNFYLKLAHRRVDLPPRPQRHITTGLQSAFYPTGYN